MWVALLTQQCNLLQIHWTQPIWSALHMPIYNIYVRLGHILWWLNSSYTSAWCSSRDTEELSNLHSVISFWSTTPRKKHLTNGSTKSQICSSDQLVPNFNILLTLVISILFPVLTIFVFHFYRNVFSRKYQTRRGCVSSGVALFASTTAMDVAGDGTSPSMVQSARLRQPLMVWSTWYKDRAAKRIYTAYDKLKGSVRKSTRALCAWDSGSAVVLVSDQLMHTQAGIQCPGSTWKKYLPHRLKIRAVDLFFVVRCFKC